MQPDEAFRAFPDLIRLPAGGGAEVVYALLSRTAHVLPAPRARALSLCRGIATLDDHAARAASAMGAPVSAVRAELADLAREGLLVPVSDIVRRVEAAVADPPPPVATLGIPTARRAASLHDALESYVADALRHGREIAYVVADGARDEEEAGPVREAVAAVRARHGVQVAYAGRAEKIDFADRLARRTGVDPALIAFALLGDDRLGHAVGGNRNALLLHAAGDLLVQVDDDTRCRISAPPGARPGLSLTSADDPCEIWPLAPPLDPPERPFVALHEDLLGRAAGSAAALHPGPLELGGASGMLLRRLSPRGGRVIVTQAGSRGDSGAGSTAHLIFVEGPSRDRMLAEEGVYREAILGRRMIHAARRAAITDGGGVMSMALGLDARAILPPFPPAQRNGDGVLGAVIRRAYHDALLGFVPWTVDHAPPESRGISIEAFHEGLGDLGANDLIRLLVIAARVEPDREDPARSLRALGDVLAGWGRLPLPDFEAVARVHVIRARALQLARIDALLSRHGRAPAFWARDADRLRDTLSAALERPGVAWPRDLVAALGEEAGRAALQRLVRRYGELLQAWPDLWDAARALRAEGVRPARVA